MIRNIIRLFSTWFPQGEGLKERKYGLAVWLILGVLILYPLAFNSTFKPLDRSDILTPQFSLNSRYILGVHYIFQSIATSAVQDGKSSNTVIDYHELIRDIDLSRSSDTDKVALAILMAEIIGKSKALDYLQKLDKSAGQNTRLQQGIRQLRAIFEKQNWQPNQAEQAYLKQRYSWLGELAIAQGMPGLEENRSRISKKSATSVTLLFSLILFLILVILATIISDLIAVFRKPKGAVFFKLNQLGPQFDYRRIVLLESIVLYMGLMALASYAMILSRFLGFMLYFSSIGAITWPLFRGFKLRELKNILGLSIGKGIFEEIISGIKTYIRCIPILFVGISITMLLIKVFGTVPEHPIIYQFENKAISQLIKWAFIACIFAPITEELIFRGLFYHYFRQKYAFWISTFTISFIFALIHPQGIIAVPAIMAISITLSIMRELRISIIASISGHMFNNTLITGFMIIMF
jgi:membrane protease YdiL (CAAX protease family)